MDAIFRFSTSRLLRVEWTEAYIRARSKCFRTFHVESAVRKAGIYPFNPEIILSTLEPLRGRPPSKNANSTRSIDPSRVLIRHSRESTPTPLDVDALYSEVITDQNIATPKRTFIKDLLYLAEKATTENTLLRRDLREKDALLNTRKTRKTGKRVAIEGRIILTRDSIIREVEKAEVATKEKKAKKGKNGRAPTPSSSEGEVEDSEDELA